MERNFVGLPQLPFKPFKIFSMFPKLLLHLVFHFIQVQIVGIIPVLSFFHLSMITNQSISFALETQVVAVLFPSDPKKAVLPFN